MKRVTAPAAGLLLVSIAGAASAQVCPGPLSTVDVNGPGLIKAAAAVDDLVVTFDQRGITTWSVVDPEHPAELGHYFIDRERRGLPPYGLGHVASVDMMVDLDGNWACIVPFFECFDLSDPGSPVPQQWGIEEWPCGDSPDNCDPRTDFALSDSVMAVVEEDREIWLLELAEGRPRRWIRPEAWIGRFGDIASVAFPGGTLLVLETDTSLSAWNVQDPEHPVELGTGTLDTVRTSVGGWMLRAHAGGAVALGGGSQGWQEMSAISTLLLPELPSRELSHELDWDPVEEIEFVGDRGVALMRTWDSVAHERVYHFSEVRVPSPFTMYVRSTIETDETALSVTADHVIGWPGSTHLEVFRLGEQLTFAGSTTRVGEILDLDVDGDIGILANATEGIVVLDLSDPENPVPLSTLRIAHESVERVRLQGQTAFLLTDGSVASVDLSQPAEPRLIKHRYIEDVCCHLEISGDTAVLGSHKDCTMPLIEISDPRSLLTFSDADYCHPGYTDTVRELQIVDDIAFVRTNWYFYGVDISDPYHPIKIVDHFDHDLQGYHATSDYILMTYYNEMRLCQINHDGDVLVGRVYDEFSAYGLESPGEDLVLADAHQRQTLFDFSNLIQPQPYEVRMTDQEMPAGETVGNIWLRPFRNMIDVMSLECRPPEASFRWNGHDHEIWFEDTSRYRVEDRLWDFGDGATSTDYAPRHTYSENGRYRVTLTVSNGVGSDTFARSIRLPDVRQSERPAISSEID